MTGKGGGMTLPRRFYRRTKNGKTLKYPENSVRPCRWCGTYFIINEGREDFCCKNPCGVMFEFFGSGEDTIRKVRVR
jgi:hypothetical protein